MRFDVSGLLRRPVGATVSYQIDEKDVVVSDDGAREAVTGTATLLRTKDGILVTAGLALSGRGTCSRCLAGLDLRLDLRVEEEFLPQVDVDTGAVLPPPEEPGAFLIGADQILDLTEAVRQYRMLALPMQPLCRVDCAGICPDCGQDLNQGACSCPREKPDARWATLAEIAKEPHGQR
jgi:uncharacterized protein